MIKFVQGRSSHIVVAENNERSNESRGMLRFKRTEAGFSAKRVRRQAGHGALPTAVQRLPPACTSTPPLSYILRVCSGTPSWHLSYILVSSVVELGRTPHQLATRPLTALPVRLVPLPPPKNRDRPLLFCWLHSLLRRLARLLSCAYAVVLLSPFA